MKISFVIPSFNSSAWLAQSIGSCLEQTHKDCEIVVVDDCSTDSTQDYMAWQTKADSRVISIRNEKNLGRSASRNIGNKAATGDVLCVLDADDLALPGRAKIVAEKFSKGCEYLYGSAVRIDACGRNLGEIRADVFNKDKMLELLSSHIVHSTVSYRKWFAEKYPYLEGDAARLGVDDITQQMRAVMDGVKFDFVPNVLSAYRILEQGITAQRDNNEVIKFKKEFAEGLRATV